ncbi:uncharacterized protein [Nothobranchius furzeri]|uniref:Uncharacterized protein n=1 Tax=Nothobranchius furzeri TaxID=105023 RepID=A0A1A8B1M7_NOTFU
MKLSGATSPCVVLVLIFTSTSAIQKLRNINDLKALKFDQNVPSHSLLLLYWFANTIDIDNNNVIRLTFDPNQGDYGSHHYGNYERLLEPLPLGNIRYRYYTVGNLNQESSSELPSYVIHPRFGYEGRNRDRIIFRVREQDVGRQTGQIVDRVYMTQHFQTSDNQGTRYDPVNTYQVTTRLLGQIREFSVQENDLIFLMNVRDRFGSNADSTQLRYIKTYWGELACLGLLLFMVIQEKPSTNQQPSQEKPPTIRNNRQPSSTQKPPSIPNNRQQSSTRRSTHSDCVVNIPDSRHSAFTGMVASHRLNQRENVSLQITTGPGGKASIHWSIIGNLTDQSMMIALYKHNMDVNALTYKSIGNRKSGRYDTSVPLNEGLQARLHIGETLCCFWRRIGEEIHRGEEFENPALVNIRGYNAHLQLFAKNGKACARLYVKKSFTEWKSIFRNSWVGFYSSQYKDTKSYEWWQWQWATEFKPNFFFDIFSEYDVYEYHSGMTIAPGVQARFILQENVEKARTQSWNK